MATKHYTITGRVTNIKTGAPVAGLQIQAWDKDLIRDDFLGTDTSDSKGVFVITFEPAIFQELFFDRDPDLYFKILAGDKLVKSTEDSVLWNVKSNEQSVEIQVDCSGQLVGTDVTTPMSVPLISTNSDAY
jgi:hypothetical protein